MKHKTIIVLGICFCLCGLIILFEVYRFSVLPYHQVEVAYRRQDNIIRTIKNDNTAELDKYIYINESASKNIENFADIDDGSKDTLLDSCLEINDDSVGWIYIPDTNIDYPIVQCEDNDFYLHHGIDGEYNYELGCPFLDYRCDESFTGFNSIVYAHNMEKRMMFADVARFSEEDFLRSHSAGALVTADEIHTVRFFCYLNAPSNSPVYHAAFITDSDRRDYIDYLYAMANYPPIIDKSEIIANEDPRLLLLSTCTFQTEDARGILVGIIE